MTTEKFTEITGLINDIEDRKRTATTNEQRLKQELIQCEMSYDLAALNNQPTHDLILKSEDLKRELQKAERTARALNKSPGAIANYLKGNTSIANLAKDIMNDNTLQIADIQKEFDCENIRLQEIKAQYLNTVAAMGSQAQEAQELANEISNVKRYIPGKETTFFQGIPDPVSHQHSTSIYLSASEIETIYRKGVIK